MHHGRKHALLLIPLTLGTGLTLLLGWLVTPSTTATGSRSMPDLEIRLYKDPNETDPFAPGNEITYEIYFINQGGHVANDVHIVDVLPEHTTYVSSSNPGFVLIQAGPDQVVWVRDHLSVFERGWLSLTIRVDDDAPEDTLIENRAHILCLDPESSYDNNEHSIPDQVRKTAPDLQITTHLWANSAPIAAGNELVYEIVPENWGGTAASNVRITATLPALCAYASDNPSGSGFTTVQIGTQVIWTRTSMAPTPKNLGPGAAENLYLHCQIDGNWTPEQWLEQTVVISTPDAESSYDNNRSRWTYKPESGRRYGAAITSADDRTMRLLSDAGFDYVLYYLSWAATEPSDNSYDWNALDGVVWQAWRYNLRLVIRLDRAPAWIRGSGSATAPPNNPGKLGELLQAVAGRWPRQPGNLDRPQIYGYVIWNEPNLAVEWGGNAPDAAAYTTLLQAAYNSVKASSADAWVISAGLATTSDDLPAAVDDRSFLQAMYTAGAGSYFDYLGANPLGFASAPDDASNPNGYSFSRAEEWRAIMEDNGDEAKSMFATEIGWLRDTPDDLGSDYNWLKISGIDQAHYLGRAYHKAQCEWPWMGPMTTWNLDFASHHARSEHPHWFGITSEEGNPLRAYRTLQNAASRGPADLWLEADLTELPQPNQPLHYTIRYTNIGGQTATGVVLTSTLPAGTEYAGDTKGGTPVGDTVIWDLGDVYTCTYEAITLTLHLTGSDEPVDYLTSKSEVSLAPGEPYTDDNVATIITPVPDLSLRKAVTPGALGPGQPLTYTLVFSNAGQALATGVILTDVLPISLTHTSLVSAGAVLTSSSSVSYTWAVQALAPGEGGTITLTGWVDPNARGIFPLTNQASITTSSVEVYRGNNRAAASSRVYAEPPVIAGTVPADGSVEVPVMAQIVVTFSQPIETGSLRYEISPDPGGWMVAWTKGDTVARLSHAAFGHGLPHVLTIAAASNLAGMDLDGAPYVLSFTSAPYRIHLPLALYGAGGALVDVP